LQAGASTSVCLIPPAQVWNRLFAGNAYSRERGLALGLSTDNATATYRYHALRTVQVGPAHQPRTACCTSAGCAASGCAAAISWRLEAP
jgi:hypothetical protein